MANVAGEITYIVAFEAGVDADLDLLDKAFREYGTYAKITNTVWSISTNEKSLEIVRKLRPMLGTSGRIFVLKSGSLASWQNTQANSEWLKKYLPT